MKIKDFFKNKKFRYGSMSVVITAVILVLIVVLNAVFSLLASHFHWYVDTTEEKLYTVSETSKTLLDEIFLPNESGRAAFEGQLTITFLQEKDRIEEASTDEGIRLRQVHELALDYAGDYPDKIKIDYVDMYTRPGALTKYKSKGVTFYPTSVIFDNGKGLFRTTPLGNFFAYDTSDKSKPIGFYGEHRITSTILSMCNKGYIAYVTEGHGEDELSSAFSMLLESCGYTLKKVNLLDESIVQSITEDNPRLIVINNPKNEFVAAGVSGRSEVVLLSEIMAGKYSDSANRSYASLMLFADPEKGCANVNLNSLLTEWGLSLHSTGADTVKETPQNALDSKLTTFFPGYASAGLATYLTNKFASSENFKAVMSGAGTLDVVDVTSSTASSENVINSAENEAGNASGKAVFAISQKENIVDGSISKYNYVIAAADASFVSEDYLNTPAYANEALTVSLVRMTTNETESTPKALLIEYKDYAEETNVQGVSNAGKQAFVIFMAVVLPMIILAVGIVVYVKRRNKV